jgi:hypothetical protein
MQMLARNGRVVCENNWLKVIEGRCKKNEEKLFSCGGKISYSIFICHKADQ